MACKESVEEITKKVFDLYRSQGDAEYLGEKVSQLEHAVQCGMLAEKEGYSHEVILGAFFHDIGHMLGDGDTDNMYTDGVKLGVKDHERVGEAYLKGFGVPEEVTCIARGHVEAKRYMCYKYPRYLKSLSPASAMTLEHQGGAMTDQEASQFTAHPHFDIMFKSRKWDEAAKVPGMDMPPMEKYEDMFRALMYNMRAFGQ